MDRLNQLNQEHDQNVYKDIQLQVSLQKHEDSDNARELIQQEQVMQEELEEKKIKIRPNNEEKLNMEGQLGEKIEAEDKSKKKHLKREEKQKNKVNMSEEKTLGKKRLQIISKTEKNLAECVKQKQTEFQKPRPNENCAKAIESLLFQKQSELEKLKMSKERIEFEGNQVQKQHKIYEKFKAYYKKVKSPTEYQQKVSYFSKILMEDERKQQIQEKDRVQKIKIQILLLQIYKGALQQALSRHPINQQELKALKTSFQLTSDYIKDVLFDNKKNVYFTAFQFINLVDGNIIREFELNTLFESCINALKELQQNQSIPSKLTELKMGHLNILTIRQSYIYYTKYLKLQLEQLVSILKQSWYLRSILLQFLKRRQMGINSRKVKNLNLIEITQQLIKQKMVQLKVIFIDYLNVMQGKTFHKDPNNTNPIIINLFQKFILHKTYDNVKSYCMFILIHEIGQWIMRKIGIIEGCEDGGWLLQKFAFNGMVIFYYDNDYNSVKKLLKMKQNPYPEQICWGLCSKKTQGKNWIPSGQKLTNNECETDKIDKISINGQNLSDKIRLAQIIEEVNNQINAVKKMVQRLKNQIQDNQQKQMNYKYRSIICKMVQEDYQNDQNQIQYDRVNENSQNISIKEIKKMIKICQQFGSRKIIKYHPVSYLRISQYIQGIHFIPASKHGGWVTYSDKNMIYKANRQLEYQKKKQEQRQVEDEDQDFDESVSYESEEMQRDQEHQEFLKEKYPQFFDQSS